MFSESFREQGLSTNPEIRGFPVATMSDNLKLELLGRLSKGVHEAEQNIHKGDRTSGEVAALLDALDLFKEKKLGNIPLYPRSVSGIQDIFDLKPRARWFSGKMVEWFYDRRPRYVGELYYIHDGRISTLRAVLAFRFDIPCDADPVALGWKPPYWNDEHTMLELDQFFYELKYDVDAEALHRRGIHCKGDLLAQVGVRKSRLSYTECCYWNEDLERQGDKGFLGDFSKNSKLWPTFVVPPTWSPPDWREDEGWKAELKKIEEQRRERREAVRECKRKRAEEAAENPSDADTKS